MGRKTSIIMRCAFLKLSHAQARPCCPCMLCFPCHHPDLTLCFCSVTSRPPHPFSAATDLLPYLRSALIPLPLLCYQLTQVSLLCCTCFFPDVLLLPLFCYPLTHLSLLGACRAVWPVSNSPSLPKPCASPAWLRLMQDKVEAKLSCMSAIEVGAVLSKQYWRWGELFVGSSIGGWNFIYECQRGRKDTVWVPSSRGSILL